MLFEEWLLECRDTNFLELPSNRVLTKSRSLGVLLCLETKGSKRS